MAPKICLQQLEALKTMLKNEPNITACKAKTNLDVFENPMKLSTVKLYLKKFRNKKEKGNKEDEKVIEDVKLCPSSSKTCNLILFTVVICRTYIDECKTERNNRAIIVYEDNNLNFLTRNCRRYIFLSKFNKIETFYCSECRSIVNKEKKTIKTLLKIENSVLSLVNSHDSSCRSFNLGKFLFKDLEVKTCNKIKEGLITPGDAYKDYLLKISSFCSLNAISYESVVTNAGFISKKTLMDTFKKHKSIEFSKILENHELTYYDNSKWIYQNLLNSKESNIDQNQSDFIFFGSSLMLNAMVSSSMIFADSTYEKAPKGWSELLIFHVVPLNEDLKKQLQSVIFY
uniref:Yippee domain-containing protein n=1 Tax=Strongyloides papillosus TaxID=174720 RepID=A0A0N5BMW1_STREA